MNSSIGTLKVLLVAQGGRLRDALLTVLAAIPEIKISAKADDDQVALRMAARLQPDLLIVDTDMSCCDSLDIIKRIKINVPHTYCLALVDSLDMHVAARSAGADKTLLRGFDTDQLIYIINWLNSNKQMHFEETL